MFSLLHLRTLRLAEIDDVARCLPPGGRILEIGAGTGEQAAELTHRGFDVTAIDLASSTYSANRVFNTVDYDGVNIPFPDQSFDVVFSSNVLEHAIELDRLEVEIQRVLRPGGKCIHLMPTPSWRLWSALTAFASAAQAGVRLSVALGGRGKEPSSYSRQVGRAAYRFAGQVYEAVRQPRHGERGNRFTELFYFTRGWWLRHFDDLGFRVVEARPAGLFYTGYMALGPRLSIPVRRRLAPWFGSACHWFVLEVADEAKRRRVRTSCEDSSDTGLMMCCLHYIHARDKHTRSNLAKQPRASPTQ